MYVNNDQHHRCYDNSVKPLGIYVAKLPAQPIATQSKNVLLLRSYHNYRTPKPVLPEKVTSPIQKQLQVKLDHN